MCSSHHHPILGPGKHRSAALMSSPLLQPELRLQKQCQRLLQPGQPTQTLHAHKPAPTPYPLPLFWKIKKSSRPLPSASCLILFPFPPPGTESGVKGDGGGGWGACSGLIAKHQELPLTEGRGCLPPASHTGPELTLAQHSSFSKSLGLFEFLSCSSSFYPRGDSLATSASTFQLPLFQPLYLQPQVLQRTSSALITFSALALWAVTSHGGHIPQDCQPTFLCQLASCPSHTAFSALTLVILLPPLCDSWSFNTSFQGLGGIRNRPLRHRKGNLLLPASVSGICFPLPSLFPLSKGLLELEKRVCPACHLGCAGTHAPDPWDLIWVCADHNLWQPCSLLSFFQASCLVGDVPLDALKCALICSWTAMK